MSIPGEVRVFDKSTANGIAVAARAPGASTLPLFPKPVANRLSIVSGLEGRMLHPTPFGIKPASDISRLTKMEECVSAVARTNPEAPSSLIGIMSTQDRNRQEAASHSVIEGCNVSARAVSVTTKAQAQEDAAQQSNGLAKNPNSSNNPKGPTI